MNKKKNNDWESWQESLFGFVIICILTILTYFFYDESVYDDRTGTKSKAFQKSLQYLDKSFGKEYVFGFLILLMIIFGISALRGYQKQKTNNNKNT
jgi:CHASE3 domain sensor protein